MTRRLQVLPLVLMVVLSPARAQEKPRDADPEWLPAELVADKPGDDELQKLLKARHREAAQELRSVAALFEQGLGHRPLDAMVTAGKHSRDSALDLCSTDVQRLDVLERFAKAMKQCEALVVRRYEAGGEPAQFLHQIRYERLTAEADVVRVRQTAKDLPKM